MMGKRLISEEMSTDWSDLFYCQLLLLLLLLNSIDSVRKCEQQQQTEYTVLCSFDYFILFDDKCVLVCVIWRANINFSWLGKKSKGICCCCCCCCCCCSCGCSWDFSLITFFLTNFEVSLSFPSSSFLTFPSTGCCYSPSFFFQFLSVCEESVCGTAAFFYCLF